MYICTGVCVCLLVGWLVNVSTTLHFSYKAVGGQCSPGGGGGGGGGERREEGRLGGWGGMDSLYIFVQVSVCLLVACLLNISTTLHFSYKAVAGQCSPGRGGVGVGRLGGGGG